MCINTHCGSVSSPVESETKLSVTDWGPSHRDASEPHSTANTHVYQRYYIQVTFNQRIRYLCSVQEFKKSGILTLTYRADSLLLVETFCAICECENS